MTTETIEYSTGTYYGETEVYHVWRIADESGVASELYVSMVTGEIINIETRSDRRGEGLARALYETACERMPVFHAPESHRTAEGSIFAEAVGGESLECTLGCCGTDDDEEV